MSTEHLLGDLSLILDALIGNDNQSRHGAEAHLSQLTVQSPDKLLLILAQVGAQGVGGFQLDQRLLALILLRRIAFRDHPKLFLNPQEPYPTAPFDVITEPTRTRIERVLGAGLEDEMDVRLRKGLGVCVGEWVKASDRRQRPFHSLPGILLKLAASQHPFHRFSPFQLLDAAPSLLSEASLTGQSISARKVTDLLLGGIHDPSVDVRVEALKATRGVLHDGMTAHERASFGPQLVAAAFLTIPSFPAPVMEYALEPMIDIASSFPDLFAPSRDEIVPFLLMCVSPPNTLSGHSFSSYPHRQMEWESWIAMANMAFEVLFSLIIADPVSAPGWENGRLVPDIVAALIGQQVAAFSAEGESCEEWLAEDDLEDEDENYPVFAEKMLDRLAQILRDDAVLQAVAQQAQELLKRQEWQARYSSLMALGSVVEGCYEGVQREIRSILELVSPAAMDAHPRVRYGFLYCLSRLCTNLEGLIQDQYSDAVLDVAQRLLDDPIDRVREASAATIVHFFDAPNVPPLTNKLQALLTGLVGALQRGPLYVQEQVLAAIAAIAIHAQKEFLPFYSDIMNFNMSIITAPGNRKQEKLVGRSMRCAALIGEAVGKENFFKDAVPLCQALLVIQNRITEPDDKSKGYLAESWLIVARVLRNDFAPFLQFVLPPVLEAASFAPKPSTLGITEEEGDEEYEWTRSSEAQEKEEAFAQLAEYVHEMRGAYAPWLSRTMAIAIDGLSSKWSQGVRESACYLVPGLLQVAKDANVWIVDPANLETMFRSLIQAITEEYEAAGVGQLYQSIGDSIRVLETPLPATNVAQLGRATLEWLMTLYERRLERAALAIDQADRGDYWLWAEEEQFEESAEAQALVSMDTTWGRVAHNNSSALATMSQIVPLAQKVRQASTQWGDEGAEATM